MHDTDKLKFGGLAYRLAQDEFAGSFSDDDDNTAVETLWEQYQRAGRPVDRAGWLRERLSSMFTWVDERPRWIEANPLWPFEGGKPMVFIRQFELPKTSLTEALLDPDVIVYVFGARRPVPEYDGWETTYRVVENQKSLAGL